MNGERTTKTQGWIDNYDITAAEWLRLETLDRDDPQDEDDIY